MSQPRPSAGSASDAPRRRRHLMDPNAPRQVRDLSAERHSLSRVQKWVMSTLAVTTILHMSVGLIFAAMLVPEQSSKIGLNVIAAAFGVMSVAAGLAIHGRKLVSPWLLLGVIPGVVGLWITL